ncbi:MAG: arylsulfatase [Rhodothermales bacterium]
MFVRSWLFALLLLAVSGPPAYAQDAPPDIVVILADDMGFSDIGAYGGEIPTPALDRLAADGVRFSQFYNAGRCVPTRAALLTGLYPHQAGLGLMEQDKGEPAYRGDLGEDVVTIADVLRTSGYGTYMAGKWHVTSQIGLWVGDTTRTAKRHWPLGRGFDRFYGTIFGAGSYYDPVTLVEDEQPLPTPEDGYYYTDAISARAAGYIAEHVRTLPDKPFFLYVAYTAPHWPLHAPEADVARHRDRYAIGWDSLRHARHARLDSTNLFSTARPALDAGSVALPPRDPAVPAWADLGADEQRWYQEAMAVYAAQIDRMDRGIGRIVQALEDAGRLDNTLLLFLSDNGATQIRLPRGWDPSLLFLPETTPDGAPVAIGNRLDLMPGPATTYQSYERGWANASNTPFRRYKQWVHEGGIATPLIAHWPQGIRTSGVSHAVGHVIDVMPTVLEAAGVAYPEAFEGRPVTSAAGVSLLPALNGRPLYRDMLFWEHTGNRAVRAGDWKLVSAYDEEADRPGPWELYNLAIDRTELNNLVAAYPERVAALSAAYEAWAERIGVLPWRTVRNLPDRSSGIRRPSR